MKGKKNRNKEYTYLCLITSEERGELLAKARDSCRKVDKRKRLNRSLRIQLRNINTLINIKQQCVVSVSHCLHDE